jgi:hypothetical protein
VHPVSEVRIADIKIVHTKTESNITGGVAEEAGGVCLDVVKGMKLGEEAEVAQKA